jgi:hypothetical protein
MRAGLMAVVLIVASASLILAKDPASYDKGLLLSMDSSACGTTEKGAKTVKGKVLGTDGELSPQKRCSAKNTFFRETALPTASDQSTASIATCFLWAIRSNTASTKTRCMYRIVKAARKSASIRSSPCRCALK